MAFAVLPLAVSAVGGFIVLRHGVIADFQDVAFRQRSQIEPIHRLSLLLWDTLPPVDEYVDEGVSKAPLEYRALRQSIEARFAEVHEGMTSEPQACTTVEHAREDWSAADAIAMEILASRHVPDDAHLADLMNRFHARVAAAVDRLASVDEVVGADVRADHDAAQISLERAEWMTGIAAGLSALAILIGVLIIGRMMSLSVDRLVTGAARFAAGDREHRIAVHVPPELRRVADEFNRMIVRIHKAEEALSSLARKDGLTGLSNRRAFDEALIEGLARVDRLGEPLALLIVDIDHFKKFNDNHGHLVGDEVLCAVAKTLANDVRLFDRTFRIGGEEFALLLPAAEATNVDMIAERLRQAVSETSIGVESQELTVTISIGGAMASPASSPNTLIAAADAALYRAKNAGRNRVVMDREARVPSHVGAHEAVKAL